MLPEEFLERMKQLLGKEYDAFLKTFEQERHQALRLNALKLNIDGKSAAEVYGRPTEEQGRLTGEYREPDREGNVVKTCFARLSPVPWAENGYYYESSDQPGKHPCHEAGIYYIQEPSAMAPAELLQVRPGDRVLDLCAAPGGKSTQLAAKLKGEGFLLCNEIHPARAKILSENVERMGIRNACVTNETPARLAEKLEGYFDKILVDAPCSGEGMFRKNEEACEEWSPENVRLCAERQDEILDCAARMLRPGGRLVYSTCTFAEEEDEESIRRFLERHPEFCIAAADGPTEGLEECEGRMPGTVRLWPHKIKGEGHFAAVLEKKGTVPEGWRASVGSGTENAVSEKELGEYFSFCRENLKGDAGQAVHGARYIRFGDNLYLAPGDMPGLKGLKVLRPGLHLGELKKNRFEPSHALALALSPREAVHVWNLSPEDSEAKAYLNGQTFPAEGEKGWYLICIDGFSMGWGKLAGNIMKNHYPKGLRVNL